MILRVHDDSKIYNDSKYFYDFEADLNIENNDFILKTITTIDNIKNQFTTSLKFSDLRTKLNSSGFDRWVIELLPNGNHNLINIYEKTRFDKFQSLEYFADSKTFGFIHIVIRAEDKSFEDTVIFINLTKDTKFKFNREYNITERIITKPPKFYYPQLSLSEINKDNEGTTIEVTTPPSVNGYVYIKTDYGHVPTKIKLVDGKGKFIFTPIGMTNEDVATVKVGYRFYSNISSIQLTK